MAKRKAAKVKNSPVKAAPNTVDATVLVPAWFPSLEIEYGQRGRECYSVRHGAHYLQLDGSWGLVHCGWIAREEAIGWAVKCALPPPGWGMLLVKWKCPLGHGANTKAAMAAAVEEAVQEGRGREETEEVLEPTLRDMRKREYGVKWIVPNAILRLDGRYFVLMNFAFDPAEAGCYLYGARGVLYVHEGDEDSERFARHEDTVGLPLALNKWKLPADFIPKLRVFLQKAEQ